ncbi:FecR family protein [Polaribacter sp. Asnod1-A03]|uniref:FecR family protein n=1 Tax=Polaribacter sp. Asnod1-A03 TaxID=3160581 RepID=UPI003869A58A
MTEKEFKTLLDKFLKGTITKEEEVLLNAFEEKAVNETKESVFNNDIEKRDIKKEILSGVKKQIKPNYYFKLAIAASITLLLGVSSFFFFNKEKDLEIFTVANTSNQIKTVYLEDGSKVVLNKNSSLRYINTFNNTRHLDLKGEAFFDVKRNEKKPFIIKTKGIKTKVLGTSFNILTNDSLVSVTVATGLVEVSNAKKAILLNPNQQVTYKNTSQTFISKNTSHQIFIAWFKDVNHLENVSMGDVASFIRHNYNTEVEFINTSLKIVPMSITINRNESLKSIIDKINYITDLKLTLKEDNMIEVK